MGESGGGHLTASLCVLLAQVVIVVINCDAGDDGDDCGAVVQSLLCGAVDLCFVDIEDNDRHFHTLLAQVVIVVINCDVGDAGQDGDDVW